MRVNLRSVVGGAQAPAGAAIGVPGAPAPPPAGEFSAQSLVDNVRNIRGALGDGRGVIRELVGLKDDLEALGIRFGPQAPPPNAPPPTVQSTAQAPGQSTVDPAIAAAMSRPPPTAGQVQGPPPPPPPDGVPAAVSPAAAPPDDEQTKALREECRSLCAQLTRDKIMETLLGVGVVLLEGKGLTVASDILVDHEVELREFLDKIPLDRLQALVAQVAVDKRPPGDLLKVKAMLMRATKEDSNDKKGAN